MSMGIVTGRIGIMNRHIRTHSVSYKLLLDKIRQQAFPWFSIQFNRQSNYKFTGKSAVLCFLIFFYGIPESRSFLPLGRGIFRQKYLLPDKSFFTGEVMLHAVIII